MKESVLKMRTQFNLGLWDNQINNRTSQKRFSFVIWRAFSPTELSRTNFIEITLNGLLKYRELTFYQRWPEPVNKGLLFCFWKACMAAISMPVFRTVRNKVDNVKSICIQFVCIGDLFLGDWLKTLKNLTVDEFLLNSIIDWFIRRIFLCKKAIVI